MANRHKGESSIEMADGTRKLVKYNQEALAQIEDLLGIDNALDVVLGGLDGSLTAQDRKHYILRKWGARVLRAFVWIGMREMGYEGSINDVGRNLSAPHHFQNVLAVINAVAEAYGFKVKDESKDRPQRNPTRTTPAPSGTGTDGESSPPSQG
jgi:hypothetical protein